MAKSNKNSSKTQSGDSLKAQVDKGEASGIETVTDRTHGNDLKADAGQPAKTDDEGAGRTDTLGMEPEVNVAHLAIDAGDTGPIQRGPEQAVNVDVPVAPDAPQQVDEDARWPLDVWRQVSLAKIGQPSHVLIAAMSEQDQDAQYNEAEVRRLVEKFLNTPAR